MNLHLWIIPLLPLAGAAINGFLGRRFPSKHWVAAVALAATLAAFAMAIYVSWQFGHLSQIPHTETLPFPWIEITGLTIDFGFYLDQLSLVMLLVVTGVGFLIHVYSVGYMAEEGGYYRFFAYLNLFMFFMLTLILSSNYLLMFVGWEGVGLASYLLIGFFFQKDSAAQAGKKAFITNRIGDFAFLLGMFLLIKNFGSLAFDHVFSAASQLPTETGHIGLLTTIALLLMVGATGKSAQIPLFVWLPDAMEGPTPVSALIHAATMVTAGIYMMARSNAIFSRAPIALTVVASIGALTAIFAASIGIVQTDIKRVLAYSTISQLGYMFMACGVTAYSAAIFHLMTHAFFKALLFLAAGSVIHALGGEQDMRKMGGLSKLIPWTFGVMCIGTAAIAGIPGLAGFFSKDEILWKAWSDPHGSWIFWLVGLITALMTSFYMFRLMYMTFAGERRQSAHDSVPAPNIPHTIADGKMKTHDKAHARVFDDDPAHDHGHGHNGVHESPWIMLAPLLLLAALSVGGGWIGVPQALGGANHFEHFLAPVFESNAESKAEAGAPGQVLGATAVESSTTVPAMHEERGMEVALTGASVGAAFLGWFLAYFFYSRRKDLPEKFAASLSGVYRTLVNKYWIDEAYYSLFVNPIVNASRGVLWRGVDVNLIDASVNGAATGSRNLSDFLRRMQSGNIRSYAGWIAFGAACVIAYMIFMGVMA